MSINFNIRKKWIFVLIAASHTQCSAKLEDCPLMSDTSQYCIKNDEGILPIHQLHIGDTSGPILAVYSQSTNWKVGVEMTNMQSTTNNINKVSDAFVLIRSTLCIDCCFIMAVNFTEYTLSDTVNETWNGMLFSSDTDLFISSENNKPATISNLVWQMGSDLGYDYECHDSSPLEIQGIIPRKTTTEKGA